MAYQHRWPRPSEYVTAPVGVVARGNAIPRPLLGALAADHDVAPG